MATAVVIPAYKPDESLLDLLRALRERTFIDSLVVVDDGSGPQYESIFAQAAQLCTLKRHAQNRGKGAAIRTGLEALGGAFNVVTADCDGQHTPSDIEKSPVPLMARWCWACRKREMPFAPKWATRSPASPSRWCRTAGFRIRKPACAAFRKAFFLVCRQLEGDRNSTRCTCCWKPAPRPAPSARWKSKPFISITTAVPTSIPCAMASAFTACCWAGKKLR